MKLIVGLGNPGIKYASTRHNIGFEAVDYIGETHRISIDKNKFKALIGEGNIGGERVVLMKPQTYMNLSGESVGACMAWYKMKPEEVVVIYDDVTLQVGQLRIRKTGSAGGHNGIKSIIQHIGGDAFPRIKVGVGEKPQGWDLADHVLGKFTNEEKELLQTRLADVNGVVEMMIKKDIDAAMNNYNGKTRR